MKQGKRVRGTVTTGSSKTAAAPRLVHRELVAAVARGAKPFNRKERRAMQALAARDTKGGNNG